MQSRSHRSPSMTPIKNCTAVQAELRSRIGIQKIGALFVPPITPLDLRALHLRASFCIWPRAAESNHPSMGLNCDWWLRPLSRTARFPAPAIMRLDKLLAIDWWLRPLSRAARFPAPAIRVGAVNVRHMGLVFAIDPLGLARLVAAFHLQAAPFLPARSPCWLLASLSSLLS